MRKHGMAAWHTVGMGVGLALTGVVLVLQSLGRWPVLLLD